MQSISATTPNAAELTFTEYLRQEYAHNACIFSAGMVDGHPVDTMYIRWQKDGDDGMILLLRPDEMAAMAWLASGVLFSHHIAPVIEAERDIRTI